MTETIEAIYDGKAFQPQEPLSLKPNTHCRLTIEVCEPDQEGGDAWAVLERLIGTVKAPPDWSEEHDHYLYGTPKKKSRRPRKPDGP